MHRQRNKLFIALISTCTVLSMAAGCSRTARADRSSLVLLIESSPVNLDPRFAADGQSQHLDGLIFSSLVARDEQMNLRGDLAASWDTPDPLTYVFHLRHDARFHDGSAVTATDVKATFDFVLNSANRSPKRGGFRMISGVEHRHDHGDLSSERTVCIFFVERVAARDWYCSRDCGSGFFAKVDRVGAVQVCKPGSG